MAAGSARPYRMPFRERWRECIGWEISGQSRPNIAIPSLMPCSREVSQADRHRPHAVAWGQRICCVDVNPPALGVLKGSGRSDSFSAKTPMWRFC